MHSKITLHYSAIRNNEWKKTTSTTSSIATRRHLTKNQNETTLAMLPHHVGLQRAAKITNCCHFRSNRSVFRRKVLKIYHLPYSDMHTNGKRHFVTWNKTKCMAKLLFIRYTQFVHSHTMSAERKRDKLFILNANHFSNGINNSPTRQINAASLSEWVGFNVPPDAV